MASKRRLRRNACEGKARHATAENAALALRGHFRKFGYDPALVIYKCQHCGGYHLGHPKKSAQRKNVCCF